MGVYDAYTGIYEAYTGKYEACKGIYMGIYAACRVPGGMVRWPVTMRNSATISSQVYSHFPTNT